MDFSGSQFQVERNHFLAPHNIRKKQKKWRMFGSCLNIQRYKNHVLNAVLSGKKLWCLERWWELCTRLNGLGSSLDGNRNSSAFIAFVKHFETRLRRLRWFAYGPCGFTLAICFSKKWRANPSTLTYQHTSTTSQALPKLKKRKCSKIHYPIQLLINHPMTHHDVHPLSPIVEWDKSINHPIIPWSNGHAQQPCALRAMLCPPRLLSSSTKFQISRPCEDQALVLNRSPLGNGD